MNRLCLLGIVTIMACNNGGTTSTTDSTATNDSTVKEADWVNLFDGTTTTGWHTYGKSSIGSAWKADSGMLHLTVPTAKEGFQNRDGGDIVTNEEYENFHLKLEWRISKNGNSGIVFLIKEDTAQYKYMWNTGPEMQVLDNDGHADGKIIKHRAGDLYDLISCSKETVKAVGEWNLAEIVVNKGKLDFFLNGTNVVSTTMWDSTWNNMVGASKFKDMPGFGKQRVGRIGLQDHGDEVWFRNIQIKRL
ncbi:MAG TPA: DUF1080 domain-containing protein [Chitinophagaceae bacterium]|nr:DUF1080 domain-containing protein [Chitinophagaceae bacterium]